MKERRFTFAEIQNGEPSPRLFVEKQLRFSGFDISAPIHVYDDYENGVRTYRQGDTPPQAQGRSTYKPAVRATAEKRQTRQAV